MTSRITINSSGTGRLTVRTTPKNRISINNMAGAGQGTGAQYLTQLRDVDATELANNNTLVYDAVSGKFVVEDLPIINGGEF